MPLLTSPLAPSAASILSAASLDLAVSIFSPFGDPLGDVRRLRFDGDEDTARVGIETHRRIGVTDVFDDAAGNLAKIEVLGAGGDFPGEDDEASLAKTFASHAAFRIFRERGVEHRVGDLITHFVGMAFA